MQTLNIDQTGLGSAIDHFERNMASHLGMAWGASENGETNLPSRRVGTKLVQELKGLLFERLFGGWVRSDLNRAHYLSPTERY